MATHTGEFLPLPRERIIQAHYLQLLMEVREQSRGNYSIPFIREVTCSSLAETSTTPSIKFEDLKPVQIKEMSINQGHKGCILVGKILLECIIINSVVSIVEDQNGDVARLAIYNYQIPPGSYKVFTPGTEIGIIEPFYKIAGDDQLRISVYSQEHVVLF